MNFEYVSVDRREVHSEYFGVYLILLYVTYLPVVYFSVIHTKLRLYAFGFVLLPPKSYCVASYELLVI